MDALQIAIKIGNEFEIERMQPLKGNYLANIIRSDWPASVAHILENINTPIIAKSSAGIGGWNAAPFMAFLDERLTTSPQRGYYPVFLYERGFKSFCLVMAQGADRLKNSLGNKAALRELKARAPRIREAAPNWQARGFSIGPFETYSRGNAALGRDADDPWAVSVAFGKRYFIDNPPNSAEFLSDISAILELYGSIYDRLGDTFIEEEIAIESLVATGELPTGATGLDGALKVDEHKKRERRERNSKLVRDVKSVRGYTCEGCEAALDSIYGKIGKEFIEAHHLIPLSQVPEQGVQLTERDFAVLCPTCHRIIHRLGCPSLDELRKIVNPKLRDFHKDIKEKKRFA
ncbi:DUF3578 domain-containing protein [Massilia sp. CFBP9012]|uniref:MrcB family domain-containing protein n=1 Tax=Massilia sp. CFBP9012 TaxID=3096531 RepID=UPI002A6B885C|nr:DUF3578 domain-containing protein [Massilia sp. CFBP9012]MDY0975846.1 DUF3578 domain-containing protein [Massilia sp. CFBP9012]